MKNNRSSSHIGSNTASNNNTKMNSDKNQKLNFETNYSYADDYYDDDYSNNNSNSNNSSDSDSDGYEDEFMSNGKVRRRSLFNRPDLTTHVQQQALPSSSSSSPPSTAATTSTTGISSSAHVFSGGRRNQSFIARNHSNPLSSRNFDHQHAPHHLSTPMMNEDFDASKNADVHNGGVNGVNSGGAETMSVPNIEDMIYHGDNIRSVQGCKKSKWKKIVYMIVTLGLVLLLVKMSKWLRVKLFFKNCPAREADYVLIQDYRGKFHLVKVKKLKIKEVSYIGVNIDTPLDQNEKQSSPVHTVEYRVFEYNYLRYLYDPDEDAFIVQYLDAYDILYDKDLLQNGLDSQTHRKRLLEYGSNSITLSAKKPKMLLKNIKDEILKPNNFLQFALLLLWWIFKQYHYYTSITLVTIVVIMFLTVYSKSKESPQKFLSEWIKNTGREVRVIRDGVSYMVGSAGLVPGDVIEINARLTLPCDLVLVRGSVEVDESALTGDTTHAQKISVFSESSSTNHNSVVVQQENTLIGGSKIISYKSKDDECPMAVVIRTGFNTSRGRLIRQFLLSQESSREAYGGELSQFAITLGMIGVISIGVTALVTRFGKYDYEFESYKPFIDLFLVICPPFITLSTLLPVFIASKNVKKGGVQRNGGGGGAPLMKFGLVDCVCYDKTGTLTQSTLGLYGVLEVKEKHFKDVVTRSIYDMSHDTINVMAACHSLCKVNHVVTGDKLEEELFQKTGYDLKREKDESVFIVHPPAAFNDRGIIQVTNVFPFSSRLQRASAVTRFPAFCVYTKGSPTSIRKICNPSTIPKNYNLLVRSYGLRGFRMIAFAKRELSDDMFFKEMKRTECEKDMTFLGFFVMKNHLHPESENEIRAMRNSRIISKMITGDSIYTAIAVSRECGLVEPLSKVLVAEVKTEGDEVNITWTDVDDGGKGRADNNSTHLAITGDAFALLRNYCKNDTQRLMYQRLITRCHIFGEMLPAQKAELVNDLKQIDYFVAMVGDGANDSLALIASDVGFSLSEADTSFAAEFSADVDHCLSSFMIRQARALLDKVTVNFKFMLLFIVIQYTVCMHNNITVLNERHVIWNNLCGFLLLIAMSMNQPVESMHKQPPPKSIMRASFLISVMIQAIVHILALSLAVNLMELSQWYLDFSITRTDVEIKALKRDYLFLFSNFQVVFTAVVVNFNCKYSRPFKNIWFLIVAAAILVSDFVILFPIRADTSAASAVQQAVWWLFDVKSLDEVLVDSAEFFLIQRWIVVSIVCGQFMVSALCEFLFQRIVSLYHRTLIKYRQNSSRYKTLVSTMPSMSRWL